MNVSKTKIAISENRYKNSKNNITKEISSIIPNLNQNIVFINDSKNKKDNKKVNEPKNNDKNNRNNNTNIITHTLYNTGNKDKKEIVIQPRKHEVINSQKPNKNVDDTKKPISKTPILTNMNNPLNQGQNIIYEKKH